MVLPRKHVRFRCIHMEEIETNDYVPGLGLKG